MAYIGNNISQTAVDTVDQRFDEFKAISIDSSAVQTIFLGGDETGVNASPEDAFGVSLNQVGCISDFGILLYNYIIN